MQYSARWSQKLNVARAGHYLFGVSSTCDARVYIDGRVIVASGQPEVVIDLETGKEYAFKVEMKKTNAMHWASVRVGMAYRPEPDDRVQRAAELAARSDVAIVFAGQPENYETEGTDRPDMDLTGRQNELIAAVAKANPKTIVVLNCGSPVAMPWVNDVAAIVLAHYPGMEGGHAIADVLCGKVNPSGKLTVTYPRALKDTPAYNNYPGSRDVVYGESIFVGYRHYDLREIEPLFPFGHGLSYTTFEYSDLKVTESVERGEAVQVSVMVKNVGKVAGKEVVQVYVSDKQSSLARPPKELKGFVKIELKPGEIKTVTFELNARALSFYDPSRKQWIAEPGEFEVLIGSSSRNIRAKVKFTLA